MTTITLADDLVAPGRQAVVELVNELLKWRPGDEAVRRLGAFLLSVGQVAPQEALAQALGYQDARSLRYLKESFRQVGVATFPEGERTGRPAVSTRPEVERAVVGALLGGALGTGCLPADEEVAVQIRERWAEGGEAVEVTANLVQTVRLRHGIYRCGGPSAGGTPAGRREARWPRAEEGAEPPSAGGGEAPFGDAGEASRAVTPAEAPVRTPEAQASSPVAPGEAPPPVAAAETPAPIVAAETPAPIVAAETPAPIVAAETPAPVAEAEVPAPVVATEAPTAATAAAVLAAAVAGAEDPAGGETRPGPPGVPAGEEPGTSAGAADRLETEEMVLGTTRWGGAFLLVPLLLTASLWSSVDRLQMPARYAVTAAQWLLTAVFGCLCGVARPFHLDDVVDVGFCLLTGRPRSLSRATFQDVLKGLPAASLVAFYHATARAEAQASGAGAQRYSVDGHGVPRWTKQVDLPKTKLHTVGKPVKADQLFFVYHLDRERNVGLQVGTGGTRLSQVVVAVIRMVQGLRQGMAGVLRFFCDRGAYKGEVFQWAQEEEGVHLYVPAVRYENNVAQWEQLRDEDFEKEPFVFDREGNLPEGERKSYRYAETRTKLVVDGAPEATIELRTLLLQDPAGKKPAERYPLVLLTTDEERGGRELLNEYGDHWGQEQSHREEKYALGLDFLPPCYHLETVVDEATGAQEHQVQFNFKNLFLVAWMKGLLYNLVRAFGEALGEPYARMYVGTLLRKFISVPAELSLRGEELHVALFPFRDQAAVGPLVETFNAARYRVPWLKNWVLQFHLSLDQPLYPLRAPDKRKLLF